MGKKTNQFKYAVVTPDGEVLWYTLSDYMETAWTQGGFDHACHAFGDEWRSKFWHRLTPSLKAAKRKGYSFKKYELVEVVDEE